MAQLHEEAFKLSDQFAQASHDDASADGLFESADQKFEEAFAATEDKALILYKWGDLYLNKGLREKRKGLRDKADESFTEARSKYDKALEINPDHEAALVNLKGALSEQSDLKEGQSKYWFISQVAEKDKQLANIKAGIPNSATPAISPENKLLRAAEFKEKGNSFFKSGDLTQAMQNWHNALNHVNGAYGFSMKQEGAVKEMKLALLNNLANVHMKQAKYDRAIKELNEVLAIDPDNVKALFRRGRVYLLAHNDIDKARVDLIKALKAAPNDKEIRNELTLLENKEKQQNAKQRAVYSKMF